MPEEVHATEPERGPDRLHLVHIAGHVEERGIVRFVGLAAAELVVGHHAIAVIRHHRMAVSHIVAGKTGTAMKNEQDPLARAVAVDGYLAALHGDATGLVGLPLFAHRSPPLLP